MFSKKMIQLSLTVATIALAPAAFAQSSALRDPLIPGASTSPPFICPPEGAPPPIGNGPTPLPITPGMGGPPNLQNWVPSIPADTIGTSMSGIPIPFGPPIEMPPGVLGPILTPVIPGPPSVPGPDPGNLQAPPTSFNPAEDVLVNPGGGLPGTGGYNTSIPTIRRGGQQTHEWDYRERNSSLVPGLGDGSQSEVTRLGPVAGWGVPFGVPTGDGLRHSVIDLGGGMQYKAGNCIIPTGSAVQDFGLNPERTSGVPGVQDNQSTDFGQGWRRIPIYSSNTTDFGLPYKQFIPQNENPQKVGQVLPPKAVETNF